MITQSLYSWGEKYLFAPSLFQKALALLFLPLSLIYCLIVYLKFLRASRKIVDPGIPVISIGNLIVGGSGKTPVTIALASKYLNSAIVLRGYGRESEGTVVVSNQGAIQTDVTQSGDEAMMLAQALPRATVIVAQDRLEGIEKARELGAELVWLDDGYSKHYIEKLDLILQSLNIKHLPFCLPAGPYREKRWPGKKSVTFTEEIDFKRHVTLQDAMQQMILITAISKPWRLDPYLPEGVVEKVHFPDHYAFDKAELEQLLKQSGAQSILTTQKDAVKMQGFGLPLSLLVLNVEVDGTMASTIQTYIESYHAKKK